jgi:hypothetical protein
VEEAMAQSCERDLYPRAGQNREGQNWVSLEGDSPETPFRHSPVSSPLYCPPNLWMPTHTNLEAPPPFPQPTALLSQILPRSLLSGFCSMALLRAATL